MVANPYEAPQARVADIAQDTEYQPINMWSPKGRIGRLRYLAYVTAGSIISSLIGAGLEAALGDGSDLLVGLVANAPFLVFFVLVGIQRSHDMNWNGWVTVLTFIPLVGLIWIFKAGTHGGNDYGGPPPPNTTGVKILAFLMPLIVVIGILAAIAIPAYSDYTQRSQQLMQQAP